MFTWKIGGIFTGIAVNAFQESKLKDIALAGVAEWIECQPMNQSVTSLIPSQGTAWVVDQVPSRGCVRGNYTLMFLFLSFSLLSPLS